MVVLTEDNGVRVKSTLFASLGDGGHLQQKECVDYPGIIITFVKQTRNHQWEKAVSFDGEDYPTIKEAIDAYNQSKVQGTSNE